MEAPKVPTGGLPGYPESGGRPLVQQFEELFDRHAPAVFRLCAHRTGQPDLAQDLTSVTFLEAWRLRARLPDDADRLPWLMSIAMNVTRNSQRSRRRYAAALARLPRPPHEPDHAERITDRGEAAASLAAAIAALDRLPAGERDVIVLVCWEQLSHEQTAAALGIAVGTVRSRLSRGRRRLTDSLTADEETPWTS